MKRLLVLAALVFTGLGLFAAPASASTLAQCLAQQHVCVSGSARSLVSASQEAQLSRQIGSQPIWVVAAPSGSSGYNSAMRQIISDLSGHSQFTVGYLDSRLRHFGAYNQGMLPSHGAASIATQVVQQHQIGQQLPGGIVRNQAHPPRLLGAQQRPQGGGVVD